MGAVEENVRVTPDENGTIKVEPFKDFNGQIKKWQEIAPLVYRSVNGQDLLAFVHDYNGNMLLAPNFPAAAEQRVSLLQSADFSQALILGVLIILGLTLLCWPLAAIIRGHYHQRLELDPSYLRLRPWVRVICAVDIAFLLIFLTVLTSGGIGALSSRTDLKFHAIQALGILGALGTIIVLMASLRSWKDPHAWFWGKVWNLLLLLACLGFVWFSYHWNLLNFNMNY